MMAPHMVSSIMVVALSVVSVEAAATPTPKCRLRDGFGQPLTVEPLRLGRAHGLATLRLFVECDAGAVGGWSVEFENAVGETVRPLRAMDGRGQPKPLPASRRDYRLEVGNRASYCRDLAASSAETPFRVEGPPGARFTAYEAEVRARFTGTGALAELSRTYAAAIYCPACSGLGARGSLYVRIPTGGVDGRDGPHLEVRLNPKWYACVRSTSTLQLRLFRGDSRRAALGALTPYAVIDGLEARIIAKGRDRRTKVPLDARTICRRGAGWVAYELWGQGELHRAGGGGRGAVEVRCR